MNNFILGCNYWASNAGTNMWSDFSEKAIREDLKLLSEYDITYLRVFPVWSDFQPVKPCYTGGTNLMEYRMSDDTFPENPYYLSEKMMERFSIFCDICAEYNIKLNVSLITGFMSGRMFLPPVLYGKDMFQDPEALYFEQLFVKGFIERFKDREVISSWDWGNEVAGCGGQRGEAWNLMISNAIKAADSSRPIMTGLATSICGNDIKTIREQALYIDMFNTHPYPYWSHYKNLDKVSNIRSLLYSAALTKMHEDLSGKPVLVQETGTMGPMVCDDELSAKFLKNGLFSNWANGAKGVMWWCANEQIELDFPPYSWSMVEVELGLSDVNKKPKPVMEEYKKFSDWLKKTNISLPKAKCDAVCILTRGENSSGIGYMNYIMACQAGINLSFCYADDFIPEGDIYILPALSGNYVMDSGLWKNLKERVKSGATLYISDNGGVLSGFNELAGVIVRDSDKAVRTRNFSYDGYGFAANVQSTVYLSLNGAELIAEDEDKNPMFIKNKYGKGEVYYLAFSPEVSCLDKAYAFDTPYYKLLKPIFEKVSKEHMINSGSSEVCVTQHFGEKNYCVMINYSDKAVKINPEINQNYKVKEIFCGDMFEFEPFGVCVAELEKA